jgi:lysophospholipase L1-like esterase
LASRILTPSQLFGSSARFIARADKVGIASRTTRSGANILTLANDGGTAGPMAKGTVACTVDETVPSGAYGAICTSSTSSVLRVASGGPTGTGGFHLVALAQMITQPGAGQNDGLFMYAGAPGNDASHKGSGIGCVAASNGAWLRNGGFGNTVAQGATLSRAVYDSGLHLYESISDGTQLIMNRDGGRLGFFTGGTDLLASGEMGFQPAYPLPSYGAPYTRIYWAGWFDRVLTDPERSLLLKYAKSEFAVSPRRYIQVTGDSITQGHISGVNTTSYVEQMVSQYAGAGETIYYNNQGITSQTTTQILARVDATYMKSFAPAGYREQWHLIAGRTNDIATLTPAQSYANLAAIVAITKAAGVKSAVLTCIPAVSMTSQNIIDLATFNGLVLANSAGADKVIDLTGIMPIPATTAYLPDNVHPSNAVLVAIAAIAIAAIG